MALTPYQRKKKREKEAMRKKHAAEAREAAKNKEAPDVEEKMRKARERREKAKNATVSVSVQNLDLATEVYQDKGCSIFIGKKANAQDQAHLEDIGITHVINCAAEIPIPEFYTELGIEFLWLEMADKSTFPIEEYFEAGCEYLDRVMSDKKKKILVHCQEGRSRSATIVCAFLIKHRNMTVQSSLATICARRQLVQPNTGFQAKLVAWEDQHRTEVAEN